MTDDRPRRYHDEPGPADGSPRLPAAPWQRGVPHVVAVALARMRQSQEDPALRGGDPDAGFLTVERLDWMVERGEGPITDALVRLEAESMAERRTDPTGGEEVWRATPALVVEIDQALAHRHPMEG